MCVLSQEGGRLVIFLGVGLHYLTYEYVWNKIQKVSIQCYHPHFRSKLASPKTTTITSLYSPPEDSPRWKCTPANMVFHPLFTHTEDCSINALQVAALSLRGGLMAVLQNPRAPALFCCGEQCWKEHPSTHSTSRHHQFWRMNTQQWSRHVRGAPDTARSGGLTSMYTCQVLAKLGFYFPMSKGKSLMC